MCAVCEAQRITAITSDVGYSALSPKADINRVKLDIDQVPRNDIAGIHNSYLPLLPLCPRSVANYRQLLKSALNRFFFGRT